MSNGADGRRAREKAVERLVLLPREHDRTDLKGMLAELALEKKSAVAEGDDAGAKEVWCLECAIEAHSSYLFAYSELKKGRFYEGWCALERAEKTLDALFPHFEDRFVELGLQFVGQHVGRWQAIFPYKWFISPAILMKRVSCSVCRATLDPRRPCGHVMGEIYAGERCHRVIEDAEIIEVSFVTDPVQKYSVPLLWKKEGSAEKPRDMHNYDLVKTVAERVRSPYQEWYFRISKRLFPPREPPVVGEACPCGSDAKFENCCRDRGGILGNHFQFYFCRARAS